MAEGEGAAEVIHLVRDLTHLTPMHTDDRTEPTREFEPVKRLKMQPLHWDEFVIGRCRALGRQYLPYLLKALLVYVLVWACFIIGICLAMRAPLESVISALKTLVIYAFFARLFIEVLPRSVDVTKNRVRIKHVLDVTLSFEDLSDSLLSPLSPNLMRWEITWRTKKGRIRKLVLAVPMETARLLETLPALSAQRHYHN